MHTVDEKDVGESRGTKHDGVAFGAASAEAVRSAIGLTEIGFDLDDTSREGSRGGLEHQPLAQASRCHHAGRACVERSG